MDLKLSESCHSHLNAHEKPPEALRAIFKDLKGRFDSSKASKHGVIDLQNTSLHSVGKIPQHILREVLGKFHGLDIGKLEANMQVHGAVFTSDEIPGLLILPSLLPPSSQRELLSRLLHRDLCNPNHKTNLHLHYDVSYPNNQASFFSEDPDKMSFQPLDASLHKPVSSGSALEKKMRWITLGGQYDWTNKKYPSEVPPEFPADIAALLRNLFPNMDPQAAIVNFYSPGDTLSLHRDVSEEVDRGLISISLGCDAIFIIGLHDEKTGITRSEVLRLRSGDALYMAGESRFAWHAVPCIVPDSCPVYLRDWPGNQYPTWKDWMQNKRVNLNVRQMRESTTQNPTYQYGFV